MNIKINNKEYDLYFGFDFIDYINNNSSLSVQGMQIGLGGVQMLSLGITNKTPSTMRLIIKGATNTLNSKPSNADIEEYISDLIVANKYDEVFDSLVQELGEHALVLREMGVSQEDIVKKLEKEEKKK
ncbi:tail assembly chaperone [Anaerococcus sp. AGMB09787]|uniref:tail assembly chaperone n=1 Tax=Anaerococcus sp. AGMB09787 TaxID=2922869 RepID=UPI001FAE84E5|nr:tail assembly chaperone [Anaerococcus sp. AGMB09787]